MTPVALGTQDKERCQVVFLEYPPRTRESEFSLCRGRHYWRLRRKGWNHRQAFFGAETFAYMRVSLIK